MKKSRRGSKASRGNPGNKAQEHEQEGPTSGERNDNKLGLTAGGDAGTANAPKVNSAALSGNQQNVNNIQAEDEDSDEELQGNLEEGLEDDEMAAQANELRRKLESHLSMSEQQEGQPPPDERRSFAYRPQNKSRFKPDYLKSSS